MGSVTHLNRKRVSVTFVVKVLRAVQGRSSPQTHAHPVGRAGGLVPHQCSLIAPGDHSPREMPAAPTRGREMKQGLQQLLRLRAVGFDRSG